MFLNFQSSMHRFVTAWVPKTTTSTRIKGILPNARLHQQWMTTTNNNNNSNDKHQNQEKQTSETKPISDLLEQWREHPALNPKLEIPTLLVPIESLTDLVPKLQPFLAKNTKVMKHIHPRIKMVQEYNDTHKLLLLNDAYGDELILEALQKATTSEVALGPKVDVDVSYKQLSYQYILGQLLSPLGIPIPSAYEQIGHIAHFNFKPVHEPYGKLIAQVLRETNPTIETVVAKVGQVHGKYRTYDYELLAGPNKLETLVVEHGVKINLHVGDCYWCSRLGGERQLLIQDILTKTANKKNLVVADIFSGVGAVCLLLSKQGSESGKNVKILANDWNPKAIEYFDKSIQLNPSLDSHDFEITCGDAYDFLMDLGDGKSKSRNFLVPDHVLMNFPLHGPTYLGALRWWPWKNIQKHHKKHGCYPRFHVYTFVKGDPDSNSTDEEELGVDIIANELLPVMGDDKSRAEEHGHRRNELDKEFETQFSTRLVRDVAPGKVVVCVSFFLTPKLVRYMQGDYV